MVLIGSLLLVLNLFMFSKKIYVVGLRLLKFFWREDSRRSKEASFGDIY